MTSGETHAETHELGMQMRRKVLGDEHVDRSLSEVTEFSRPVRELVDEYCWGVVWAADNLDPKIRSLLNLAMLTALNRPYELGVHVRGAIANGATLTEIQATLLQCAIYLGVPAALDSFRVAERVLREMGLDV